MGDMAYRFDPDSLREVLDDADTARDRVRQLRAQLRGVLCPIAELRVRGQLVGLLRMLGELDEALTEARRAVDRADAIAGEAQQHTARLRLAQVLQWRGDFDASNEIFAGLVGAAGRLGPAIEAFTHQHAGKNAYDQELWAVAHDHFAEALAIREEHGLPDAASSQLALDAAGRREATR